MIRRRAEKVIVVCICFSFAGYNWLPVPGEGFPVFLHRYPPYELVGDLLWCITLTPCTNNSDSFLYQNQAPTSENKLDAHA